MDRRAFLLTASAAGLATPVMAATPTTEAFTGLVGGAAVDLERQVAAFKQQMKAMGYGGADVFYELKGAASPVRFTAASAPAFLIVAPADQDPQTRFGLFSLTPVKNTRRLTTGKVNPLGYGTRSTKNQAAVAFTATRYGQDAFQLTPDAPLPAGEYGLAIAPSLGNNSWGWGGRGGGNQPVFAFGVD